MPILIANFSWSLMKSLPFSVVPCQFGVTQDVHLHTYRLLTFRFWEFRTVWLESAVWRQFSSRPTCNILKVAYELRQCTFDYLFKLIVLCGRCSF